MIKVPKIPPNVQIELCNICNAKCSTCPTPKMKRKRGIMKFELFKKIIDDLESINFEGNILPFLNGESLLVKNFTNYLRYIRLKIPKSKIILFTNASLLNEDLSNEIIKEDLIDELIVSFDGGTKKSYESIRIGLSFDKVKNNIHRLIQIRDNLKKEHPKVKITMVVTPENTDTRNKLTEEFIDVDDINFSIMFNWGGQLSNSFNKDISSSKNNFCSLLYDTIYILQNGDVCLCCFDYEGIEKIGKIQNSPIKEIWLGEELQNKRNLLKNREFSELDLCRNCDVINCNVLTQHLIKSRSIINSYFPNTSKFFENVYKSLKFRLDIYRLNK